MVVIEVPNIGGVLPDDDTLVGGYVALELSLSRLLQVEMAVDDRPDRVLGAVIKSDV